MKGGGIVFLVIFIFFFICFVWGIASVVKNTSDALQSKCTAKKSDHPTKPNPSLAEKRMPNSSAHAHATNNAALLKSYDYQTIACTLEKSAGACDAMARTLEHLQKVGEMHQQMLLTDEEFATIKAKLIQEI